MGKVEASGMRTRRPAISNYGLLGFVILTLGISGCSLPIGESQGPSVASLAAPTAVVEATLAPTETGTIAPTQTPLPTATIIPSSTPDYLLDLNRAHETAAYSLPLTVQYSGQSTATVLFAVNPALSGRLFYWPESAGSSENAQWIRFDESDFRHQIILPDLEEGVEYQIAVGITSEDGIYRPPQFGSGLWDPIGFETQEPITLPLRIGVFGDSGFGDPATFLLAGELAARNPDLVLHTGDMVYRADEEGNPQAAFLAKYYAPLSPILHTSPLFPLLGNHDFDAPTFFQDQPYYFYAFPPFEDPALGMSDIDGRNEYYAFAYGDVQFIMLNSQALFGIGDIERQTEWLEERLADARFRVSIPVLHVPPYSSSRHADESAVPRTRWGPLFEEAGVPLVLSGHDHNYERLHVGETTYIVTGGGSATLYELTELREESVIFESKTHFVLMEINANLITIKVYGSGGQLLDEAVIEL